jgi:glutamate-5-semialdehyde dehydrogenase
MSEVLFQPSPFLDSESVIALAERASRAARALARLQTAQKNAALHLIARSIAAQTGEILEANERDLKAARPLVDSGRLTQSAYSRLMLSEAKVLDMARGVEQVAALDDPVGRITLATQLDDRLNLYRVSCPIGVIGVVFESRPDALVQISALCIKSGNAVLLKGGSEAERSNRALFDLVHGAALSAGIPCDAMGLLGTREDVTALLAAGAYVDLVIPRGSNALVRFVQQNTLIPVLGHAEGICHIYVDQNADLEKAMNVTLDAKVQYPAVCNAVETLLVHRGVARQFLPGAIANLQREGVEIRCDEESAREFKLSGVAIADQSDWRTEYGDLILSVRVVDSIAEAIDHINRFGSHHTDAIITEDRSAFDQFFAEVDSAGVFLNASTRFADGFRYGFGAEVGISTGKLHPRGPVGLDGLVTYKYKLLGEGQTVGNYTGPGARKFNHSAIPSDS